MNIILLTCFLSFFCLAGSIHEIIWNGVDRTRRIEQEALKRGDPLSSLRRLKKSDAEISIEKRKARIEEIRQLLRRSESNPAFMTGITKEDQPQKAELNSELTSLLTDKGADDPDSNPTTSLNLECVSKTCEWKVPGIYTMPGTSTHDQGAAKPQSAQEPRQSIGTSAEWDPELMIPYMKAFKPVNEAIKVMLLQQLRIGIRILEVGSGAYGGIRRYLPSDAQELHTAITLSEGNGKSYDLLKIRFPNSLHAAAETLPQATGEKFDLVVAVNVMDCIGSGGAKYTQTALNGMKKVLAPGGEIKLIHFLIPTPNFTSEIINARGQDYVALPYNQKMMIHNEEVWLPGVAFVKRDRFEELVKETPNFRRLAHPTNGQDLAFPFRSIFNDEPVEFYRLADLLNKTEIECKTFQELYVEFLREQAAKVGLNMEVISHQLATAPVPSGEGFVFIYHGGARLKTNEAKLFYQVISLKLEQ